MLHTRATRRLPTAPLLWLWALASLARRACPAAGFAVRSGPRRPHGSDLTKRQASPDPDAQPDEYDFDALERALRERAREEERRSLTVVRRADVAEEGGLSENQRSLVSFVVCAALIAGLANASQGWLEAFSARPTDAQFEPPAATKEWDAYRTTKRASTDEPGSQKVDLDALMKD